MLIMFTLNMSKLFLHILPFSLKLNQHKYYIIYYHTHAHIHTSTKLCCYKKKRRRKMSNLLKCSTKLKIAEPCQFHKVMYCGILQFPNSKTHKSKSGVMNYWRLFMELSPLLNMKLCTSLRSNKTLDNKS